MEMKPRASVSPDQQSKARPVKKPAKPSMPFLAQAPQIATPKPKKPKTADEPAAQKPDFKLTGDMLKGDAPLRRQYERHIEERGQEDKAGVKPRGTDLKRRRDKERDQEEAGARGKPQLKQRRRRNSNQDDSMQQSPGKGIRRRKKNRKGTVVHKTEAEVALPLTIRNLSEAMGRPARELTAVLWKSTGVEVGINDQIAEEVAQELALELGVDLVIKRGRDIEVELSAQVEHEDDPDLLQSRPPVITILGHVDHGKTTLLDTIRKANVAAGEAGGITQHIAAYQVEHEGKKLTFVDTPGHAAFGEMRARGANVTDIIVLVVAADDGVMPQTVECISHAKAAKVPIVVAMNKIDRPDTDEQRILSELASHEIVASEWGGDVEVVRTSALKGTGIDKLLETLLLTAELQDFQANPEAPASGICLEAFRDEGRGVLAWLMVKKGTLKIGDVVLCGSAYGRVRAIYDDRDQEVPEAGPSTPVKIAGLDSMPGAGDQFYIMSDIEDARLASDERRHAGLAERLGSSGRPKTIEDILTKARGGVVQDLPVILKADSPGSLEALSHEITKFEHPEVRVEIVHQGVGGVNESDVSLASAAGAIIIAFHVVADENATLLADREGVEIRRYNIIYEITDHIKLALEGLLIPERVQETTGRALVLQTFKISRFGTIAGCRVLNGTIERNSRVT
jgi:translation initiation factor IF-2